MKTTSSIVTIVGFTLERYLPIPQVTIKCDDGSKIVITESFFNTHGFKLGDAVTISISDISDEEGENQ